MSKQEILWIVLPYLTGEKGGLSLEDRLTLLANLIVGRYVEKDRAVDLPLPHLKRTITCRNNRPLPMFAKDRTKLKILEMLVFEEGNHWKSLTYLLDAINKIYKGV